MDELASFRSLRRTFLPREPTPPVYLVVEAASFSEEGRDVGLEIGAIS